MLTYTIMISSRHRGVIWNRVGWSDEIERAFGWLLPQYHYISEIFTRGPTVNEEAFS